MDSSIDSLPFQEKSETSGESPHTKKGEGTVGLSRALPTHAPHSAQIKALETIFNETAQKFTTGEQITRSIPARATKSPLLNPQHKETMSLCVCGRILMPIYYV